MVEAAAKVLRRVEALIALGDARAPSIGHLAEIRAVAERRRRLVDTHALVSAGAVRSGRLAARDNAQVTVTVNASVEHTARHLSLAPLGQLGECRAGKE